ncbi:very-long-chain 3-oxoacyl-CoA reductase 1-like [Hordeum vulgare subsp. vulgare]|uniref:B-keto acyl reductase n=2 Tax=Hordeum vulgare subsp. vulgare TaxID=112509 RepID=A0A8I6YDU0_HORVV|nr:very-long-chain 3-oxoacyl-CoA reductase 1-like [Hordeum vulgare subsp. vulgare]
MAWCHNKKKGKDGQRMAFLRQEQAAPAWFLSLAFLGALCASAFSFRLLAYLALCLRRPKDLRRRYGAWAVVTGPTSGIGRSVALELASRGLNLVLVDLSAANLKEISHTVRSRHAVQTKTVVFDLSLVSTAQGDEAMRRLREAVAGLDVGVLVNNAGVAKPGAVYLHEPDVEAWVRMVRVNLWAVTEVTAAVLPGMVERGRGAVINMGSASSEAIPSFPLYTIYGATKRYVAQFSRSLYVEYRSKGIDVQCQAPFYVATKMVSMLAKTGWAGRLSMFLIAPTPDAYARAAVRWIGHGPPLCTPNLGHQLMWCLAAILPDFVHDWLRMHEHLQHRALAQRGYSRAATLK